MDVIMPQLGETVAEGTIGTWFKGVGSEVSEGEVLFEVETDKVTMEVQALRSGHLTEIRVAEGDTALVGAVVAVIGDGGSQAAAAPSLPVEQASTAPENGAVALDPYFEVRTPKTIGKSTASNGIKVTPLARRLIAQNGLDIEALAQSVAQSGRRRIMRDDVLQAVSGDDGTKAIAPIGTVAAQAAQGDFEVVTFNRIRRATGAHLAKAWHEVPHVVQGAEVNFQRVEKVRASANAESVSRGVKLTYLPFIARAVCLAIRDYPHVNANLVEDHLRVYQRVNLGIAVDLDHGGLVVPVIKGADDLTIIGLARSIEAAAQRARSGSLAADDLSGATYTISNSGAFGTFFTAPIVNAPEVAILSVDGVKKKPIVIEGEDGDHLGIGRIGVLAQSFDHRAFDGAYSAAFLRRVRQIIETRDWSLEL